MTINKHMEHRILFIFATIVETNPARTFRHGCDAVVCLRWRLGEGKPSRFDREEEEGRGNGSAGLTVHAISRKLPRAARLSTTRPT